VKSDFRTDTSKIAIPLPKSTDPPDEVKPIDFESLLPIISEEVEISVYDDREKDNDNDNDNGNGNNDTKDDDDDSDDSDEMIFVMFPLTEEEVIEMPFTLCPVLQYCKRAFIGSDWKVFLHDNETVYVGDYKMPPRTAMETNSLLLACFSAAANCNDIPTLYRFFLKVKSCAGICGLWSELGHALDKFCMYLESCNWDHIGKIHDLIYFAVEAGEAHDAAFHRGEESSMKPAMLSYKRAAMASLNGKWPIGKNYAGHAWCCYGLSLKRAGEYVMACRAYQLALLYTTPQHAINVTIYLNMKSLCEVMYKASGNGNNGKSYNSDPSVLQMYTPQVIMKPCNNCKIMCQSPKVCGGCLISTYCSVYCQRADWSRHKKECKKMRPVVVSGKSVIHNSKSSLK
jgi:hypothetical protein